MEAVVGVKYRPVVFPNGGAAAVGKSKATVAAAAAVYRECLKNHAASLGGHAVDGCGEFMPSPAADAADPASLKCAACGCHRNFHRRLPEAPPPSPPLLALPPPPPPPPPQPQQTTAAAMAAPAVAPHLLHGSHQRREQSPEIDRVRGPGHHHDDGDDYADGDDDSEDSEMSDYDDDRSASPLQAPPPVLSPGYLPSATHMLLSLGSAPAAAASRPHAAMGPPPPPGVATSASASASRKRFRTKFSSEQKQRMQALSERLGWRLQKRDEAVVEECCREIGVGKGVFKVWMHNNKHNFLGGHSARRSASATAAAAPLAPPPVLTDFSINGSSTHAAVAADHAAATASGGSPQST